MPWRARAWSRGPRSTVSSPGAYGLVDLCATGAVTDRITADVVVQNALGRRYRAYSDALASPGLVAEAALSIAFATR